MYNALIRSINKKKCIKRPYLCKLLKPLLIKRSIWNAEGNKNMLKTLVLSKNKYLIVNFEYV